MGSVLGSSHTVQSMASSAPSVSILSSASILREFFCTSTDNLRGRRFLPPVLLPLILWVCGGEEALILASLASFSRSRPDVCTRFPVLSFTGDPTVLEPSDLSPSFAPLHMLSLCLAFYSPCLADKLISSSKCCSNVSSPITFPLISPLSLVETPSVSWLYVLQGLGLYIFVHHCIPILWHSI